MLSISEVRSALGSNTNLEEQLESIRQGVIALWERRTGRKWQLATGQTQIFTALGTGVQSLWIPNGPVTAVTKVEQLSSSTWTEITSGSYVLVDTTRIDRTDGLLFENVVKVTFTGGYDSTTCPYDIKTALLTQIKFMLARMSGDKVILRTEAFEGGASTYETADLHPYFKTQAQHYSRRV